jgi:cell division protein FtsB
VKPLHYPLIGLLLLLQYPLWFGSASVTEVMRLQHQVTEQTQHNLSLQERNQALEADVKNLKSGMDAIEERARLELGMVRPGETFYQVVVPGK